MSTSAAFLADHENAAQRTLFAGADWIKDLSARGVCSDVTTLVELIKLDESGKVENLQEKVTGMATISRADVLNLTRPAPEPEPEVMPAHQEQHQEPANNESQGKELQTQTPADFESEPAVFSGKDIGSGEDDDGSDDAKASKPKKEKEPELENEVYISGRKGYVQTKSVEIRWNDTETFEKIPLKDLPPEMFQ